jgi:hypothetical protein
VAEHGQDDGTFDFPAAFGAVVPNMPDHIYTDLDTSFRHFRIPGGRLPRKANEEIREERELLDPVEILDEVAIPEEVSDALRTATSGLSVAEQTTTGQCQTLQRWYVPMSIPEASYLSPRLRIVLCPWSGWTFLTKLTRRWTMDNCVRLKLTGPSTLDIRLEF